MLKEVDLGDNRNIFVASAILITGIGGFVLKFAGIEITEVACALIIGIVVNLIVNKKHDEPKSKYSSEEELQKVLDDQYSDM